MTNSSPKVQLIYKSPLRPLLALSYHKAWNTLKTSVFELDITSKVMFNNLHKKHLARSM